MKENISPETPIRELSTSDELLGFATAYHFNSIKEMLALGFNELHKYMGFDYRLQREIVQLVQIYHWENLLEPE